MYKYFRTLFKLIRFFLDDEFLFIGHPKDDDYYIVICLTRQLLKNHIIHPFKTMRTLKIKPEYASAFEEKFPTRALMNEKLLWPRYLTLRGVINYKNDVISSLKYTYLNR